MAPIAAPAPRKDADPNLITGVAASSGLAVGDVYQVRHVEIQVKEEGGTPDQERRLLDDAVDKAAGQLEALRAQVHGHKEQAKAAIFAAHSELLEDPDLIEIATSAIAKGKSAAFAWKNAVKSHAERLAGLRNQLLAQRANDLRDVGERVLEILTGVKREAPSYPANAVLIAEDLTPSDTAAMERGKVMGFATVRGGATSHVAILARSLGIPALAGIEARALELPNGTPVILDGSKGTLRLKPSPEEMKKLREALICHEQQRKEDLAHALEPATTTDGRNIEVAGNIGGPKDAGEVAQLGGDGVGLLRSEFLFMERSAPPSEDEQFEEYKAIALALGADRPLIIRTLDVGGDKPLAYLPIPKEDNPFLGERGIRVGLDRPEILRTQLRALLRASQFGIQAFSNWAVHGQPAIAFTLYGIVERALIPFGLHHVWNVPFFFQAGEFVDPSTGQTVRGEIARFIAGDATAGNMTSGYLFKMWGLPAAAAAITLAARPENRAKIGGIMISAALTAFLTGITEPIEFAFLFVAPVLYGIHALLAGVAYLVCILLGIRHGFTFSHGLIDSVVLFPKSTNALWLPWCFSPPSRNDAPNTNNVMDAFTSMNCPPRKG